MPRDASGRFGCRVPGSISSLCGPQGTRVPPGTSTPPRGGRSAAHRSAAMAGGARPDPFRTRKLSRRAPMVLRGKPVGEQGAADRWTALPYRCRAGPSGAPLLFCLLSTSLLSVCYRLHVASSFLFGGACRRSRNRGRPLLRLGWPSCPACSVPIARGARAPVPIRADSHCAPTPGSRWLCPPCTWPEGARPPYV